MGMFQMFKSSPSFCHLVAKLLIEWICIRDEWMLINAFRVQSKKKFKQYFHEMAEAFFSFYSMIQCNLSPIISNLSFDWNRRKPLNEVTFDHHSAVEDIVDKFWSANFSFASRCSRNSRIWKLVQSFGEWDSTRSVVFIWLFLGGYFEW